MPKNTPEYNALITLAHLGTCRPLKFAQYMGYKENHRSKYGLAAIGATRLNYLAKKGLVVKIPRRSIRLDNGYTYIPYEYRLSELGVYRLFFYDTE